MGFRKWLQHYQGILLISFAGVSTLWLGATDQLGLYIHPRYNTFTLAACGLGLLLVAWSFGLRPHDLRQQSPALFGVLVVLICSFLALLVVRPSTLSGELANQRGINSAANTEALAKLAQADIVSPFGASDFTQLSVKDWANLLAQTNDHAFFVDKHVRVSGFVVPDAADPQNRFFVSRFIVSCCAVDARPVGVPVYSPNWQTSYRTDQWVSVDGLFASQDFRLALDKPSIQVIDQPKDPYVY